MKLTLSNDKQYVLLPIVEDKGKHKSIQLLAWDSKKLKPFEFPAKLVKNLSEIDCEPKSTVKAV